jgi:riboflavin biosynthesis pyrimidine reductase
MNPVQAQPSDTATAAANTAVTLTYAAHTDGQAHVVGEIIASYSAVPTGGNLTIEDGAGTTVFQADITAAGPVAIVFDPPIASRRNTALIITLAAGGTSVVGKLNARHWTIVP